MWRYKRRPSPTPHAGDHVFGVFLSWDHHFYSCLHVMKMPSSLVARRSYMIFGILIVASERGLARQGRIAIIRIIAPNVLSSRTRMHRRACFGVGRSQRSGEFDPATPPSHITEGEKEKRMMEYRCSHGSCTVPRSSIHCVSSQSQKTMCRKIQENKRLVLHACRTHAVVQLLRPPCR